MPSAAQGLYVTCANCHGTEGQGVWSTNAPRLAGMSDWYLVRQLNNFRTGVRGRHPQDFYGAQMAELSGCWTTSRQTADLVAYIGTLRGEPHASRAPRMHQPAAGRGHAEH